MTRFTLSADFHHSVRGLYNVGAVPVGKADPFPVTLNLEIFEGKVKRIFDRDNNEYPIDQTIAHSNEFTLAHDGAFGVYSEEYGFGDADCTRYAPATCLALWMPAFKDWTFITACAKSPNDVQDLFMESGPNILTSINFAGYMIDPLTIGRIHPRYSRLAHFDPIVGRYVPEGWRWNALRGRNEEV